MQETYKRVELLKKSLANALSLEVTNQMLHLGGEPELYSKNRRDAICMFCINLQMGLEKCNELLERYDEVTL